MRETRPRERPLGIGRQALGIARDRIVETARGLVHEPEVIGNPPRRRAKGARGLQLARRLGKLPQ